MRSAGLSGTAAWVSFNTIPLVGYVASMLHGAADSTLQPLRMLGNFLRHTRHEKGRFAPAYLTFSLVFSIWWGR
jgi:hypothetical protein